MYDVLYVCMFIMYYGCFKRFWTSTPAPILLGAGALALTTSTFLACVWPMSRPDGIPTLGLERKPPYALPVFIWVYCILWWFVQVGGVNVFCTGYDYNARLFQLL